jgi:UDP-N-acetylglucosamine 2-epimerase (non-hydrolysing)
MIVVRRSTERPEVLGTFATLLPADSDFSRLANGWIASLDDLHLSLRDMPSPFGDGLASQRIAERIGSQFSLESRLENADI